jgi:anti-sigma factor RsiW
MNCKKIRDRIITDYIDQEASKAMQEEILVHLKTCSGCRVFEQALREKVSEPLRRIEAARPPESIWQQVQETIEGEVAQDNSPSFLRRVYDFLADAVLMHKPRVALSAAFAVILITALFLRGPFYRQWAVKGYLREQSDFMQSMSLPVNGELEKDIGFGTAIESIFFGELS